MNHWTIGKRIVIGGATMLALLLTVGALGVIALRNVENTASSRLRDDAIPGIIAMSDIGEYTLAGHIQVLLASGSTNNADRDKFIVEGATHAEQVSKAMEAYERAIADQTDRANFGQLTTLRAAYLAARKDFVELIKADKKADAEKFLGEKVGPAFKAYRDQTDAMLRWNQDAAKTATLDVIGQTNAAVTSSAIVCIP